MAFILAAERDCSTDVPALFRAYREYLAANCGRFAPSAYALATADWYFDFRDPRCPHDAWLEQLLVAEPATGERGEVRHVAIRLRLLGASQDGHIELYYPRVFRYSLDLGAGDQGHRDWRYDEFRTTAEGHLVHEIEWWGPSQAGSWIIEASDVEFTRQPAASSKGTPAA